MTNPVEPIKSKVVGLIPVRIMLTNQLFLFNLLFFSAPFQTLYAPKAVGCIRQAPNKSIEIADSKHDTTGFATKFASISSQLLAVSPNDQFGKIQFFLRHTVPVYNRPGIK